MKLNPALIDALDRTASEQPEVMPTAPILRQEAAAVNEKEVLTETPVKRGRGRPKKDGPVSEARTKSFIGGATDGVDKDAAVRGEISKQVTALIEQSGCALAGDAARMEEGEKVALSANLDNYMKAKGINDIPPGLLLAMGLSMYYVRVLNTPDKNNIPVGTKVIFWFKQKFARKPKYARSNNGNDGIGQNDTGKTAGSPLQA